MSDLSDIDVAVIPTSRLEVCVRWIADRDAGVPVVFVHGNVSSSPFFFATMAAMPERYRPIAIDLRGFGGTQTLPVDATRGLRDFADDLRATLEALELPRVHLVGWSMGGGVVAAGGDRRNAAGRLADPDQPGVAVRIRRDDRPGRRAGLSGRIGIRRRDGEPGVRRGARHAASPTATTRTHRDRCCWTYYVAPGWDGEDEEILPGVDAVDVDRRGQLSGRLDDVADVARDRAGRSRRAQHHGPDVPGPLRLRRCQPQAARAVGARRARPDRLGRLRVRPGPARCARSAPGLSGNRRDPPAADGRPDPVGAGCLCRRRWQVLRRSSSRPSVTHRTSRTRARSWMPLFRSSTGRQGSGPRTDPANGLIGPAGVSFGTAIRSWCPCPGGRSPTGPADAAGSAPPARSPGTGRPGSR